MGFMKHFRSRSRLKEAQANGNGSYHHDPMPTRQGPDLTTLLDRRDTEPILRRIFTYVCPHVLDDTYESCEKSVVGEGCMLCDLRDLSNCCKVKRSWYGVAAGYLYHSIRIDAVHYCELEELLAEKKRRRSFVDKHGEPLDVPTMRLQLLERTLRESRLLAESVQFLKIPFMTRETCKSDLARTISFLKNLRYVDLPEGFYTGDVSCHTLRQELMARCPDIRKMKYDQGAEQSFELLLNRYWQRLEILELSRLRIEPSLLRQILSSLPALRDLVMSDLDWLSDSMFQSTPAYPDFPPIQSLSLSHTPQVTAAGLASYLSQPMVRETLTHISFESTGISASTLHYILQGAVCLTDLTIIDTVTASFPMDPIPPLASRSLRTLHYEIESPESQHLSLHKPSESYYNYLRSSLFSNTLPYLHSIYVRDPTFPETLLLVPPAPSFAGDSASSRSRSLSPAGLMQPLDVYTKDVDELEWVFTTVLPPTQAGRRGSITGGRPLSSYSAKLGPQWGGDNRKSMVVGNGFGGFLAVPTEEYGGGRRPSSSGGLKPNFKDGHERRGSRADLWR